MRNAGFFFLVLFQNGTSDIVTAGCHLRRTGMELASKDHIRKYARKALTKKAKEAAWAKTQGRCWYCGKNVVGKKEAGPNYRITQNIDHMTMGREWDDYCI